MELAIAQGELKSLALDSSNPPKVLINVLNICSSIMYQCLVSTGAISTEFLGIPCHNHSISTFLINNTIDDFTCWLIK